MNETKVCLKKALVLASIILFVAADALPSTVGTIEEKTVYSDYTSRGYIQALIDNASDGDTIYIPSGIYYENIIIDKSISLIGENRNSTVIDGSKNDNVVEVIARMVTISGFTIQNSGDRYLDVGLSIKSSLNTIKDNNIMFNNNGIDISLGINNNVSDNNILFNTKGINAGFKTTIMNNIITNNDLWGVKVGRFNKVFGNNISENNESGLNIRGSFNKIIHNILSKNGGYGGITVENYFNIISTNTISLNKEYGISFFYTAPIGIVHSRFNFVIKNNFIDNEKDATFGDGPNFWLLNYWNTPRLLPKPIFGHISMIIRVPWISFDWFPAQEPYDIR